VLVLDLLDCYPKRLFGYQKLLLLSKYWNFTFPEISRRRHSLLRHTRRPRAYQRAQNPPPASQGLLPPQDLLRRHQLRARRIPERRWRQHHRQERPGQRRPQWPRELDRPLRLLPLLLRLRSGPGSGLALPLPLLQERRRRLPYSLLHFPLPGRHTAIFPRAQPGPVHQPGTP